MACTLDFRRLDEGLGGERNKRKRSSEEDQHSNEIPMEIEQPSAKRAAITVEGQDKPVYGKPTYDGVIAGKVSGRKWKQPKQTRASAIRVSHKRSTFEERAKLKQIKKAHQETINDLKEQIRSNKAEKRKLREEREKKKKENVLKSGMKLQKITNPKTLKKLSKSKKKKQLMVVPDEVMRK
ncbi:hypothetical protein SUGI_0086390 [Cryptomeria japonica]|uniref:uncharacterized protein LOC131050292 n=1 Tax=Cryptomeria japonica TaxID=3369 RepID=UPI002408ED23|nr:uncharacterized protein LOC131050292 [Cryptomeria japonica]GLJ08318.1 hypothetical protein SUGI_0086390 [Cryptomeria japonica]